MRSVPTKGLNCQDDSSAPTPPSPFDALGMPSSRSCTARHASSKKPTPRNTSPQPSHGRPERSPRERNSVSQRWELGLSDALRPRDRAPSARRAFLSPARSRVRGRRRRPFEPAGSRIGGPIQEPSHAGTDHLVPQGYRVLHREQPAGVRARVKSRGATLLMRLAHSAARGPGEGPATPPRPLPVAGGPWQTARTVGCERRDEQYVECVTEAVGKASCTVCRVRGWRGREDDGRDANVLRVATRQDGFLEELSARRSE